MNRLHLLLLTSVFASGLGCDSSQTKYTHESNADNSVIPEPISPEEPAPETPFSLDYTVHHYDRQGLIEAIADKADSELQIADVEWRLEAYGYEDDFIRITPSNGAELIVSGNPWSAIKGSDGCNRFFGALQPTEDGWIADSIFGTLKACYNLISVNGMPVNNEGQGLYAAYVEQQGFFYDVISNVADIEIDNGVLFLRSDETKMLVLTAQERLQ